MGFYYNVAGDEAVVLLYLISGIIGLVGYVFLSLGLYTIAQRRGISNPWLAWIPVASMWLVGSISDQYQQVAKNKKTNRRKVLLWLEIAMCVITVVFFVIVFVLIFQLGMTEDYMYPEYEYISYAAEPDAEIMNTVMSLFMVIMVTSLVITVMSIVYLVFWCMAYYDIYSSCDPKNATLFTVLSVLVSVVAPYLVFAMRNKDLGMYPPAPPQWGHPGYYPPQPQYYQPPVQHYQPPVQHYQPPVQHYQPPVQQYQPPHYQAPVQTYQPPQPPVTAPVQQTPVATQPQAPVTPAPTTPEDTEA